MTNPALWVAIGGTITALGTLIHSIMTARQINQHEAAPHPGQVDKLPN